MKEKYIVYAVLLLFIIISMFFVGRVYYIKGGRVACTNTESYLTDQFACEPLPDNPLEPEDTGVLDVWIVGGG